MPDRDTLDDDHFDQYLNSEVLLPLGDSYKTGKVTRRLVDSDGKEKGLASSNPILDTREYNVEFPDGAEAQYSANTIAENMFAQCNIDGHQHLIMKALIDYKKDHQAVAIGDQYVYVKGKKSKRKTTKGWHICVEWRDGTSTWERLAALKESNPVEVAEFATAQGIDHEPAFAWWVPFTLKKRDRIIAAVNNRYHKRTHKFGIEMLKSVADAKRIDVANGNTYWQDAIATEIKAVRIAFKKLHGNEKVPLVTNR